MLNETLNKAAQKWDKAHAAKKRKWLQLRQCRNYFNQKIAEGSNFNRVTEAYAWRLQQELKNKSSYQKAISIGCGMGKPEMELIQQGIVEQFDFFEISPVAIEKGKAIAKKLGVQNKVNFYQDDVFSLDIKDKYDLVYWKSSLHHMLDVNAAVGFCKKIMKVGGVFSAFDYVGPNRFQYSDINLEMINKTLAAIPDQYFKHFKKPDELLPKIITQPSAEKLMAHDPTEAADSENILPAIKHYFPEANITILGGGIARLVLDYIGHNLDEDKQEDDTLIKFILLIDDMAAKLGIYHNVFIVARKSVKITIIKG
jgi:SAM-dependent methyltransferase